MKKSAANNVAQLRFSGFSVLVLLVLVLGVVVIAPSLHTLFEQQRELAELRAQTNSALDEVDHLTDERARWSDPSYVRAQARERLYYVLPGESSFLVINDLESGNSQTEHAVSDQIQQTEIDWVGQFAASVMIAGLSEAPPQTLISPNFGKK
ncbi:MAG: septum formation initiator family protein [Microbacteriaceae bacterium]